MKKNVTDETRRKYQKVGRLRLEDALKQMRENPHAAMEGWSEARKKAWRAIDKNPNSYYYRFNAPDEAQRTGPWTQAEQKLFHQRLKEMGANGQWGVFSMVIPGRVGYQCSNYYRQLIETSKIKDPNYVLDDKGKAHYLFSTKDGRKTFRTHCKHKRDGSSYFRPKSVRGTAAEDGDDDDEFVAPATAEVAEVAAAPASTRTRSRASSSKKATTASAPAATATTASATAPAKRRRRSRRNSDDDFGSTDNSDDDWAYGRERDEDYSGDYRTSSSAGQGTTKRARAARGRRAAATAAVAGMNACDAQTAEEDPLLGADGEEVGAGVLVSGGGGGGRVANCGINPLPGYIDPITLEEVVKPAISPFGHVMGYDNWVRCLTRSEPRNVCPITKNPLSKRDLVVLTLDNIADYRNKIVSM
ncbi:hypothetical protein THASP1DRAFT_24705 [Thamnocephalis sphaerospora]|uniref:Myb-like domain-containing protein n=1 Tax=Thamnocephalis sphaerospora TaxID=78915 RepID=A0A4P9XMD3_9FUNG|nr:hypothetical protein THASP1DRAFT_24705 [Thamnocephalis sphaerospora]|eukprot:RKP07077.1 hypothetical protein THASP1DRAFT_24705 [Thamnocephalis sphaerospora]